MEWIFGGIAFGFLGSFHCIGMCGPLALALPGANKKKPALVFSRIVYNLGRVVMCSLLGVIVGLLSRMISFGGFQRWFSITVGILILLGVFISSFRDKLGQLKAFPSKIAGRATQPIKKLFKKGTTGSLFFIGLLNALLPCGFIYMALATALTTGTVLKSFYFMAGFGFGTVPAMMAASMASGFISLSFRQRLRQFSPYFMALVGLLLIIRGLDLGIMFLSPNL